MIRPLTLVTMLLAAASGLYLYQAKQQARMLDRQIRQVREQTDAVRQRVEVLRAEYTLLNDPTRLAELVSAYLPELRPTQPAQWTSIAELDKRLPPVGEPVAPPSPLEPQAPDAAPPGARPVAEAKPPTSPLPAAAAASVPAVVAASAAVAVAAPVAQRPATVMRPQIPAARPPVALAHDAQLPPPSLAPMRQISRGIVATPLPPPARLTAPRSAPPAVPATPVLATLSAPTPAPPAAVEPTVPVVASALGMARTMVAPVSVTPANAAALPTRLAR